MADKIYVIGAGAIGGLVGGRITQSIGKENVTLVDTDIEHVQAIRNNGLKIFDKGQKDGRVETVDIDITTPDHINYAKLNNVILATKSYSNKIAVGGLSEDIDMLILQNGFDESLFRFSNAVRGVEFGFACKVQQPGYVFNAVKGKYVLGGCGVNQEKIIKWANLLNSAGIKAQIKSNIDGYLWSKLLINSTLNPVSAVNGFSFKELIETDSSRDLFKKLYMEGYPIVKRKTDHMQQKLGSFLGPPNIVNCLFHKPKLSDIVLKRVADKFGEVESSMLQDVRKKRPTEIEHINGAIIKLGKEYGMETPQNELIYQQVKKLEPQ